MRPDDPSRWDFDVAVIGGGPAGSTCAAALARRRRRVLLLERERFPRFHIGESLLANVSDLFDRIGLDPAEFGDRFVEKWGASFVTADGDVSRYVDFTAALQTPRPRTWQVERSKFDDMLLRHALASGAEVHQETRALHATFAPDGVEVAFAGEQGGERRARVGAVVDASGRAGFLSARLGHRRPDPRLRKVAVHAHYEGIARPEGRRGGDIRIVSRPDLGWFWFIPLAGERMSVGVVVDHAVHAARPQGTLEETLAAYIAETPQAVAWCRTARRISPVRTEADFSYHADRHAGDRYLLAGDAGAFLDPVFSTGVMLAMTSGVEAAEAIDAGLTAGDLSARRFQPYERRLHRRYLHFRRFVAGFYEAPFRDVFFQPTARLGLAPAVTSILAGNWRPSWAVRWRIAVFFALVWMQRYVTVVPRTHSGALSSAAPPVAAPAVAPGDGVTTTTGS